jgi:hypothetical protein
MGACSAQLVSVGLKRGVLAASSANLPNLPMVSVGLKRGVLAAMVCVETVGEEESSSIWKANWQRQEKGLAKLPDLKPIDTRKESAKTAEARVDPLADHGEIGNGRKDQSRPDNVNSTKGGNNTTYTLRRLARDKPALLDKIEARCSG